MWSWPLWKATAYMWGAILGDVLIMLGVVALARCLTPRVVPPGGRGWAALLVVGLLAAVALEWAAQALGLWGYSDWMPVVTVAGRRVGLSPVVQVTLLPALSAYFAGAARLLSTGPVRS
jgi:hypothetical protein